jgi:erythromycin esterase
MILLALFLLTLTACLPSKATPPTSDTHPGQTPSPSPGHTPSQTPSTPAITPTSSAAPDVQVFPEQVKLWMADQAVPFSIPDDKSDCEALEPLLTMIGEARVVSLGEATHSTHEFLEMRNWIITCLVTKKGFNLITLEASWPETRTLNTKILSGDENLKEALQGLLFWHLYSTEYLALVSWMRDYDRTHELKVEIEGIDFQFPSEILVMIENYLRKVDPTIASQAQKSLLCFRTHVMPGLSLSSATPYDEKEASIQEKCRADLAALDTIFIDNQSLFTAATSEKDYQATHHAVSTLIQAEKVYAAADDQEEAIHLRDQFMAENALWWLSQNEDTKMIVLAHNGHIQKENASGEIPIPMGAILKEALGEDLVAIGFGFNKGQFNSFLVDQEKGISSGLQEITASPPLDNSHETYLSQIQYEQYYLDLRLTEEDPLIAAWFAEPRWLRAIGAAYDANDLELTSGWGTLPGWFDILIFFQSTHPAKLIKD